MYEEMNMKIENRFIAFPLHQCCENSRNYWVTSSVLEAMWQRDQYHRGSYIPEWNGPPHHNFFSIDDSNKLSVVMPCIQLIVRPDGDHIVYVQGRGKTLRWLLNSGLETVPVAVYNDIGIEKAGTGIIWQRVGSRDRVKVRNDFDPQVIVEEKLAQQALIDNFDAKGLFRQEPGT